MTYFRFMPKFMTDAPSVLAGNFEVLNCRFLKWAILLGLIIAELFHGSAHAQVTSLTQQAPPNPQKNVSVQSNERPSTPPPQAAPASTAATQLSPPSAAKVAAPDEVIAVAPPPTAALTVVDAAIQTGQHTTIIWSSSNADSCTLTIYDANNVAVVSADLGKSGSSSVPNSSLNIPSLPVGQLNLKLSCIGGATSAESTKPLTVKGRPTAVLKSASESIHVGKSDELTWTSIDASTCTLSEGQKVIRISTQAADKEVVSPTEVNQHTYVLICTGTADALGEGPIQSTPVTAILNVVAPKTRLYIRPNSDNEPSTEVSSAKEGGVVVQTQSVGEGQSALAQTPSDSNYRGKIHHRRILLGNTIKLDWSSDYSTYCKKTGGDWTDASTKFLPLGSASVIPTKLGTSEYSMSCGDDDGLSPPATVTIIAMPTWFSSASIGYQRDFFSSSSTSSPVFGVDVFLQNFIGGGPSTLLDNEGYLWGDGHLKYGPDLLLNTQYVDVVFGSTTQANTPPSGGSNTNIGTAPGTMDLTAAKSINLAVALFQPIYYNPDELSWGAVTDLGWALSTENSNSVPASRRQYGGGFRAEWNNDRDVGRPLGFVSLEGGHTEGLHGQRIYLNTRIPLFPFSTNGEVCLVGNGNLSFQNKASGGSIYTFGIDIVIPTLQLPDFVKGLIPSSQAGVADSQKKS